MRTNRRNSYVSSSGRTASRPAGSSPSGVVPSHEAIARRAFLKWQARGCPSGTHLQDWLEAEAELKAELGQGRRG
jgi:hypothetical protein